MAIKIKIRLVITGLAILILYSCHKNVKVSEIISFNENWGFLKTDTTMFSVTQVAEINDSLWKDISLPHTASIEPLVMKDQQWTGICWYKKNFFVEKENQGKHIAILIEAAMNDAVFWLNGTEIERHQGGYLPIFLDISDKANFGAENTLLVRVDNRNNPQIPPGKHLTELDFNYYSGIYRNAYFMIKDKLHFSYPLEIDSLYGGGLIVSSTNVSANEANVNIGVSIINQDERSREYYIEVLIKNQEKNLVSSIKSEMFRIPALTSQRIPLTVTVPAPNLWSPDSPGLYTLETILHADNRILESENTSIGIREIEINREGFFINGKKIQIRGTNRHQDYPYVGYALSDNAQYRDARKIKDAGFNFVRSSHYPQSPAFLDACDELGLLVMDAIPGWQFIGDSVFREISYQNTREMCRRDRNHPSIIMWEASLNETEMPADFIQKSHNIVHEELPFEGIYTCGWMDTIFDVFIPARQHAKPPDYWNKYNKNKPIFIAEYGSWEYYAQNAGFNQTEFKDLLPAERSSRQLRGYGEIHLLQQAYNFQEAFNSNLAGPAIGSSNWGMFDYNRGYSDNVETSGMMDLFRLPKFTYWFYKSQADSEPVCFIASFNTESSAKYIRIFSNGDSVSLYRNGKLFATQNPDKNAGTANLPHPPFTFIVNSFEPGSIRAEAFRAGIKWAEHSISTAGKATKLKLEADLSGRALKADGGDVIFVYASITDKDGNLLSNSVLPVKFTVDGDATLIGDNPFTSEAGIACILLQAGKKKGKIVIKAESRDIISASIEIVAE